MILYGSIEANNGKPMMAILDLRPVEGKLIINDMQKVNSVYTKDKPVGSLIRSAVMYADKKRTIPLLRSMGLHIGPKDLLQNGSMGRITYGSKSVKLDGVPFREVVNLSGRSTEETLTETTVGDDGNIYLPGGPVPEAVKRQRTKDAARSQEPKRQEKFSVDDEEILTETEVGDDGNIYLPGGPVPEAVKRMRAQQEDRSQKAGGPERFFADKTDGLMSRMTREEIRAVQSIERKSINEFAAEDFKVTEGLARRYWVEMGEKSPFFRAWFGDWRANDQTPISIADQQGAERGVFKNRDTGWDIQISGKVFNEVKTHQGVRSRAVQNLVPYIDDIVEKAVLLDTYSMGIEKLKSENSLLMHSLYAVTDPGNGKYVVKLYVEEMHDPNKKSTAKRAYKLVNIERQQLGAKGSGLLPSPVTPTADIVSVADLFEAVKRADRNFRPGVSSKVVDEAGRPMAVYHGTDRGFWSFDPELGAYWISREIDYAQAMAEERGGDRVLSAYISMKNPMRISLPMGRFTDPAAEGPYIRRAKAEGYDGVIFDTDTDNPMMADTFYVVFRPEQIKSATENIGTFDLNNPDIRYSVEDEEVLTETEVGDDGNIYLPGGPVPEAVKRMRAKGLDRASSAAYDGENQKEAVDYEQGGIESGNEETDLQAVRNGRQGTSAEDRRGKSEVLEAFRGNESRDTQRSQSKREIPEWARRHLTKEPKTKGCEQAKLAGSQYVGEVYLVKHDALQEARSENNKVVWGMTENGTVFLSDQVPDDIGITVGYHEVVHVAKQQDFHAYTDFLERTITYVRNSSRAESVLDILADSRFDSNFMNLNTAQRKTVYDELNALVWGVYKEDADNARFQFEDVFKNYDDYIRELDSIMEQMRITYESDRNAVGENSLIETSIGDNEKFSVEDEETLAEFALGDDGHIYLPAHNGSITDAARHMYIHRNTYIYRLEKIKTLLGTDLRNPRKLLELQLGLMSNHILQS